MLILLCFAIMEKEKRKFKYLVFIWIIPIIYLIVTLSIPMPYYCYQLLKWVVCVISSIMCFIIWDNHLIHPKRDRLKFETIFIFGAIAVLYNPIAPVHFTKEVWIYINSFTLSIFLADCIWFIFENRKKRTIFK